MARLVKKPITESKVNKNTGVSGYLPEVYQGFYVRFPDIGKAIDNVAEVCQSDSPLDKETAELIKLGIAIGINSEGAVRSHARRAIELGIPPGKIIRTVLLAFTTAGFPHTIAAYKWVEEVLVKADTKI